MKTVATKVLALSLFLPIMSLTMELELQEQKEENPIMELARRVPSLAMETEQAKINALVEAAEKKNNLAGVKQALKKGVDIDGKNDNGWTALVVAAARGSSKVVKLLLEQNATVDERETEHNGTALLFATKSQIKGSLNVVRLLIGGGAGVNEEDKFDWTALMLAAYYNEHKKAKLLLQSNADVFKKNEKGKTARQIAEKRGNNRIVQLIAKQIQENLYKAAKDGNEAKMEQALKEGHADINEKDKQGFTALMWAAIENHENAAKYLLNNNANVNEKNNIGETALIFAARKGNAEMSELLINSDVDINAQSNSGETALMEAIQAGHVNVVRTLLKKKYAHRLYIFITSNKGKTALKISEEQGNNAIVRLIKKREHIQSNFWTGVTKENLAKVRRALRAGANINEPIEHGGETETALMYTIQHGSFKIADLLFEWKDGFDATASMKLLESDEVAKISEYMATANEEDIKNFTRAIQADDLNKKFGATEQGLLHIAAITECLPIAKFLVENNADVNLHNKAGLRPLIFATFTKNKKMIQFLLQNGACKEKLPAENKLLSRWALIKK